MTPLPPPLGSGEFVLWRLDRARHAPTWNSGEGSFLAGGRWNSRGRRAVYMSLDPATAILEVAVHKTFAALDTVPHVLTAVFLRDPVRLHVIAMDEIPNENWLRPGMPSAGQQAFGDDLLSRHPIVLLPSVVSRHSWNAIVDPVAAESLYGSVIQESFALDTRLHPPNTS